MKRFDGVMIGRAAYKSPYILSEISSLAFHRAPVSRLDVMQKMTDYAKEQLASGVKMHAMTRHMLGLYNGYHGARAWRRMLGEELRGSQDAGALIGAAEAIETLLAKKQSDRELQSRHMPHHHTRKRKSHYE